MNGDSVLLYMTAADDQEARTISQALVAERLVACANILGPMSSVYRWEGKVETSAEIAVILKTQRDLIAKVTARVEALHSYDCPCVVAISITGGHPPFLQWIKDETQAAD